MKNNCKYNHNASKYKSGQCSECARIAAKKYSQNDSAKRLNKERQQKRRDEKKDHINKLRREAYARNPEPIKQDRKAQKAWRRAQKLKATPVWSDKEKIKEIYNNCPKGFQVDHIVPLKSNVVSGLHVPENLQYLTKADNIRKSNNFTSGQV